MSEAAQDKGGAPALEYATAVANRESGRARRRALAGAAVLAGVAAVAGAALQALDDGGARLGVSRHWMIGLFVAGAAAVLAAGALLGRRAGSPVWKTVLAAALVFGVWLAALSLFDASPLRGTVGYIYGNETQTQLAFNGFAMRLFLCWAATLMVGGASLLLARGREQVMWIGVALVLGLGSALAWGGSRMAGRGRGCGR